jgi:hypothetical protein
MALQLAGKDLKPGHLDGVNGASEALDEFIVDNSYQRYSTSARKWSQQPAAEGLVPNRHHAISKR